MYCVVAGARAPSLAGVPKGPAGLGPPRLLPVDGPAGRKLWIVAADAPVRRFNEAEINRRLSDVDWVSRVAVGHERVVAAFIQADAVLPMKLFTIFSSDARAAAHLQAEHAHVERVLARVAKHDEWGVRLVFDGAKAPRATASKAPATTGTSYLAQKKGQRDARVELVERSREAATDLYERLAAAASDARRRGASELPASHASLLLDAAFLVPRSRAARFRASVAAQAKALLPRGYHVSVTGPWPPYTFMSEA